MAGGHPQRWVTGKQFGEAFNIFQHAPLVVGGSLSSPAFYYGAIQLHGSQAAFFPGITALGIQDVASMLRGTLQPW